MAKRGGPSFASLHIFPLRIASVQKGRESQISASVFDRPEREIGYVFHCLVLTKWVQTSHCKFPIFTEIQATIQCLIFPKFILQLMQAFTNNGGKFVQIGQEVIFSGTNLKCFSPERSPFNFINRSKEPGTGPFQCQLLSLVALYPVGVENQGLNVHQFVQFPIEEYLTSWK